eukprot:scaffold171789_cov27-Tisochrysis_lutea.AAC.1
MAAMVCVRVLFVRVSGRAARAMARAHLVGRVVRSRTLRRQRSQRRVHGHTARAGAGGYDG